MKIILLVLLAVGQVFGAVGEITVKHFDGSVTGPFAEDQLQFVIDNPTTVCGDIIEINPGASRHYSYPYILRGPGVPHALGGPVSAPTYVKNCASSGRYITIRSSQAYQLTPGKRVGAEDAANLAFVGGLPFVPSLSCTVFVTETGASYWRLQGLEVAPSGVDCSGVYPIMQISNLTYAGGYGMGRTEDQFPNYIIIDQCWLHGIDGFPIRNGIQMNGNHLTLSNSTIENIRQGLDNSIETHAVVLATGASIRIFNNKLSSQGVPLISGGEITETRRGAEYVELVNNWIYRPFKFLDWSGTTDPSPSSPCPVDSDAHGATYHNTTGATYWECQGALPGLWTSISSGTYAALIAARIPGWFKNLIEFKRIYNFHMEGNLSDQSPSYTADNQIGTCLLFSLLDGPSGKHENVLVENNICRHAGWGFRTSSDLVFKNPNNETSYWANGGRAMHNIVVRNNYYHHMGENFYNHPGFGDDCYNTPFQCTSGFTSYVSDLMDGVTLDHNTFDSRLTDVTVQATTKSVGIRLDRADNHWTNGIVPINQRVTNNIIAAGRRPISSGDGGADHNTLAKNGGPSAEIAANAFVDYLPMGTSNTTDTGVNSLDTMKWHCVPGSANCPYQSLYTTYPPNCVGGGKAISGAIMPGTCMYDIPANLGFTSYPDDLTLQSGSPMKGAGLDGKDLGADLNTVGWATAGAEAGTMAPYLAMKIRLIRPTATTAFVRFSAINTASCTVDARVYGKPLASPVATATVNTGELDRTTTLTGLTANTKYGLKVTCAGSYYREADFRTP